MFWLAFQAGKLAGLGSLSPTRLQVLATAMAASVQCQPVRGLSAIWFRKFSLECNSCLVEWCVCLVVAIRPLHYAAILSWEASQIVVGYPFALFWITMAMEDVCRLFAVVDGNGELVGSVPASWFQDAETHKSLEVFCQRLVNFDHC